jgi:hypothetical protein
MDANMVWVVADLLHNREGTGSRFLLPTSLCHEYWVKTESRALSGNEGGMKIV